VTGILVQDSVTVTGYVTPNFTFTAATTYQDKLPADAPQDVDGIVGMSFAPGKCFEICCMK
jgi:hypothetical protein